LLDKILQKIMVYIIEQLEKNITTTVIKEKIPFFNFISHDPPMRIYFWC